MTIMTLDERANLEGYHISFLLLRDNEPPPQRHPAYVETTQLGLCQPSSEYHAFTRANPLPFPSMQPNNSIIPSDTTQLLNETCLPPPLTAVICLRQTSLQGSYTGQAYRVLHMMGIATRVPHWPCTWMLHPISIPH